MRRGCINWKSGGMGVMAEQMHGWQELADCFSLENADMEVASL